MLWPLSFPCDHFYADHDSFRLTIRSAVECAEYNPESIILVGADAEYPETDYGWIEPGVVVSNATVGPLSLVSRFWEKPSLQQAHALLRRGLPLEYFRNSRPGDDML